MLFVPTFCVVFERRGISFVPSLLLLLLLARRLF